MRLTFPFIFFIAIIFTSCAAIKPVSITGIENFRTENPLTSPEFRFDMGIKNPNAYGVTLKKLGVDVMFADSVLAGIHTDKKQRIAPHATMTIPLTFQPSVNMLKGIFMSGLQSMFSDLRKQELVVKGEITVRKFIFRKKIHFREAVKF